MRNFFHLVLFVSGSMAALVASLLGLFVLDTYALPLAASYIALLGFALYRAIKILDALALKKKLPIQVHLSTMLLLSLGFGAAMASKHFNYKVDLSSEEIAKYQKHISDPKYFEGWSHAKILRMEKHYSGIPYAVEHTAFWFDQPLTDGRLEAWWPPHPEDPEFAHAANFIWFLLLASALSALTVRIQDGKRSDVPTSPAPSHTSEDPTVPPASSVR
jgi:hypothetical protein